MYQISCFSASAYTPIMGLIEITELKTKKQRKKQTTITTTKLTCAQTCFMEIILPLPVTVTNDNK